MLMNKKVNPLIQKTLIFVWNQKRDVSKTKSDGINIIVDTGASKSVISSEELEKIAKPLSKSERKLLDINHQQKQSKIKFGNGSPIEATKVVHIPIRWKGVEITLKMNVLNQKVPTLLGLEAMTKMKAQINIAEQMMEINGTKRKIKVNETGHIIWENMQINKDKIANEKRDFETLFAS